MHVLLGTCVALIAFVAASALSSLAAFLAFRVWGSRFAAAPPARRAHFLFSLRVLPGALSLAFVSTIVVPAFVAFEPPGPGEGVGLKLLLPAILGGLLLSGGLMRGLRSWTASRRLVSNWADGAEPVAVPGIAVPAYRIEHPFPVVCLEGILRPRLFVARQVLERFTTRELAAVAAHEVGHLDARDNLKGLILRACPDWLSLLPVGTRLDREWSRASEAAADDHSARVAGPLDLAAALIKVARLAPPGTRALMPASALHSGDGLARRVARLTGDSAGSDPQAASTRGWRRAAAWIPVSGTFVLALAFRSELLQAVHDLTEVVVRSLQ